MGLHLETDLFRVGKPTCREPPPGREANGRLVIDVVWTGETEEQGVLKKVVTS